jgi:hypothetical protein
MRFADSGKKQTKIIIQLGNSALLSNAGFVKSISAEMAIVGESPSIAFHNRFFPFAAETGERMKTMTPCIASALRHEWCQKPATICLIQKHR